MKFKILGFTVAVIAATYTARRVRVCYLENS